MRIAWVLVAFLANGSAQFLQKYLHAIGLGAYQKSALITLYAAGALFAVVLLLWFRGRLSRIEALFGAAIGLTSYAGNAALLRALGDTPAYVVFPMVVGGPILTVAILSRVLFRERIGTPGKIGILCGFIAVVLLTTG
jgi:drug/metabolite transporter (DMT)-like permease